MTKEYYEFDPKRRRLSKIYSRQKLLMSIGNSIVIPLIVISLLYLAGFFSKLADWALQYGIIAGVVLFILITSIIMLIFEFPLRFYGTFVYEHKYKLSNHSLGTWFIDYIKETMLELILAIPMSSVIAFMAMNLRFWWVYAAAVSVVFSIFVSFIHPIIIIPLTYKLTPYRNKTELKRILEIIKKVGVSNIRKIKIMHESEKSNKVNAMFTGIGKTKMILLYDTLLKKFTKREIRTVIGHELGHYVHKDIIKTEIFGTIQTVIVLFLIDKFIKTFFTHGQLMTLSTIPILSGSLIVLGFIIMPISMAYSRRLERKADGFALDHIKDPLAQISTDKKLCDIDLSDDNPPKWVEFWFYSHPAARKRIKQSRDWLSQHS